MSKIFISYRREDSADVTGRICDRLREYFGEEKIFTDVDNIPLGVDFRDHIDNEVSQCNVLLAVIGKDWLSARNSDDGLRLNDPADFVRIEIESALRRDIPVIPLLVQGAGIPQTNQLPESIGNLAYRNAQKIRADPDFKNDANRLLQSLVKHLDSEETESSERDLVLDPVDDVEPAEAGQSTITQWLRRNLMWLGTGGAIAAVVSVFPLLSYSPPIDRSNDDIPETVKSRSDSDVSSTEKIISAQIPELTNTDFIPPDMVVIPAGTFMMGSETGRPRERPVHRVTVPAFELARNELTWAEWRMCEDADGCEKIVRPDFFSRIVLSEQSLHPVVSVDVTSVNEYLTWINERTRSTYRLPSEAEWEYATRAGSTNVYFWGDAVKQNRANCQGCGSHVLDKSSAPVGSFDENPFGLNDVHGNVLEWTADCWHDNYENAPNDGSAWVDHCTKASWRPVRGGSWISVPEVMRAAYRDDRHTGTANDYVGLRLARTLP